MTFAEELRNISDKASFNIEISNNYKIIKEMMKECAAIGMRTFQIDVVSMNPGVTDKKLPKENNYHTILINRNYSIDNYYDAIMDFLLMQGFSQNNIEVAHLYTIDYSSILISVRW